MCRWVHPAAAPLQFPWIIDTVQEHSGLISDYPVGWRSPCSWRCLHFSSPMSLLSPPLLNQSLPYFSVYCTFVTHCSGLTRDAHNGGQCFLSPSEPSPSITPCCIPRAWFALVQCGHESHSVQAISFAGSPELIQLHHSSQHTTQTGNRAQKASLPFCTRLTGKAGRNGVHPISCLSGKSRHIPVLFIILTTFLSCWLSIQLCPWLWSTWHWICTLKTKQSERKPQWIS